MADERSEIPNRDDLDAPFLFVRHGDPLPIEWMARHPAWVNCLEPSPSFPGLVPSAQGAVKPGEGGFTPGPRTPPLPGFMPAPRKRTCCPGARQRNRARPSSIIATRAWKAA